ncbi:peptidoglycan-binding domain-containing protein [Catenuloplanes atrovinosus]|uniref:Murein L,D-transpeptidase YcbB/YkuD n=1 Tax=Catenuloplanes atrovinosus TaxID=137266 RepID=A0AAE4C930_9ACTN|nr:peptidoglycan-binding domain-containing protein [Catenuloplanes atrovinosus]MDR7275623.1 murein L,D-transpeptidase YcbB/YkuD [Catenuloplanes atrovinosus]
MTVTTTLSAMATALSGLVADSANPPADARTVRRLLEALRLGTGDGSPDALARAVRRFQAAVGLPTDGVAGPRTVHMMITTLRQA